MHINYVQIITLASQYLRSWTPFLINKYIYCNKVRKSSHNDYIAQKKRVRTKIIINGLKCHLQFYSSIINLSGCYCSKQKEKCSQYRVIFQSTVRYFKFFTTHARYERNILFFSWYQKTCLKESEFEWSRHRALFIT